MTDEQIKAVDDALLRAWHLGISNGINGESENPSAWRRADAAQAKFGELRESIRTMLTAGKEA